MRRSGSQLDLPGKLREISALDRAGCVARWTAAFDTAPPKYLSIQFMQRVLAREEQIRALKAALRNAGGEGEASRSAPPGSYLMREWNGRTYRVEVTSSGYVLDGRTYASLSTVANRITGAHWSGPRFFGLTRKRAS